MYRLERLYFVENPLLAVFRKMGNIVINMFISLDRGMRLVKTANENPDDREAIWQILEEK